MDGLSGAPETRLDVEGRVGTVTLQRGRANALTATMVEGLSAHVVEAAGAGCTVLVLRSAEPQFCAGFDLGEGSTSADLTLRFLRIGALLESVLRAPMLTVALVEGAAIGAGADLAAACDVRIGTSRARFRFPGSAFGVVLGTRRLAGLVGDAAAVRLASTGATLDAAAALAAGLLDRLVEPDQVPGTLDDVVAGAVDRAPGVLAGLKAAVADPDPAGLGDLARSLAAVPDLASALSTYRSSTRKEAS